jgi:hypothetical protein
LGGTSKLLGQDISHKRFLVTSGKIFAWDSPAVTLSRFVVENGQPGVQRD